MKRHKLLTLALCLSCFAPASTYASSPLSVFKKVTTAVLIMYAAQHTVPTHAQTDSSLGLVGFFEQECPLQWEKYGNATGRVIIGAGNYTDSTRNGSNETTAYQLGLTGGEMYHALTIDEIPPHTHIYNNPNNATGAGLPRGATTAGFASPPKATTTTGGGASHYNMPPFLVLVQCIKVVPDSYASEQQLVTVNETIYKNLMQRMATMNSSIYASLEASTSKQDSEYEKLAQELTTVNASLQSLRISIYNITQKADYDMVISDYHTLTYRNIIALSVAGFNTLIVAFMCFRSCRANRAGAYQQFQQGAGG